MAFLGFLGFVGIIIGIVLMIRNKKKEVKTKTGRNILIASIVIYIIALAIPNGDNEQTASNEEEADNKEETEEVEEETDESNIEGKLIDEVGEENVREVGEVDSGINIVLDLKDNFTSNMMRDGANMEMVDVLQIVDDGEVENVFINYYTTLVDEYGNEEEESVITATFTRETMDKINYENISYSNIPNVADDYWMHPALEEW